MTPDDILRDHSPEVRAIAEALRRLLRETAPEMTERAYPGWHAIGFRHPRAGYVCGLFPLASAVRLVFEHGRELSDPDNLLTGDGKQVRYIDIASVAAIPADALRPLLLEAIALRE